MALVPDEMYFHWVTTAQEVKQIKNINNRTTYIVTLAYPIPVYTLSLSDGSGRFSVSNQVRLTVKESRNGAFFVTQAYPIPQKGNKDMSALQRFIQNPMSNFISIHNDDEND